MKRTVIIGTGHYLPEVIKTNADFLTHDFYDEKGEPYPNSNEDIIAKFQKITHIEERRYIRPDQSCSEISTIAAERAIEDAGIDRETLDYIIVATNFGDVSDGGTRLDLLPSIAARVKHNLGIKTSNTVCYDMMFGCPGWVESMIHAEAFIKAGMAKRVLVIGTEVLSRIVDPNDRNAMIFADGSGAAVVECKETDEPIGMLANNSHSYTLEEVSYINNGKTYDPNSKREDLYIKMQGRKIYEFSLNNVPKAIRETIEDANLDIHDIDKILIHQANEKMDEAIIYRLYKSYNIRQIPEGAMPMTIAKYGNSSVATVPTMLDLIRRGQLDGHELHKGDTVVMTSVGAGMHINAFVYRF